MKPRVRKPGELIRLRNTKHLGLVVSRSWMEARPKEGLYRHRSYQVILLGDATATTIPEPNIDPLWSWGTDVEEDVS